MVVSGTGKVIRECSVDSIRCRNEIYYSPISLWEISIKYGLKKLTLKETLINSPVQRINQRFLRWSDVWSARAGFRFKSGDKPLRCIYKVIKRGV